MRAALYYGRQDLRLMSVAEPEPEAGEVKLRVRYNGICGSDLHEYYDGPITTRSTPHPLTGLKNPVIMAHELCGEVVALGAGIEDLAVRTSSRLNRPRAAVSACTADWASTTTVRCSRSRATTAAADWPSTPW